MRIKLLTGIAILSLVLSSCAKNETVVQPNISSEDTSSVNFFIDISSAQSSSSKSVSSEVISSQPVSSSTSSSTVSSAPPASSKAVSSKSVSSTVASSQAVSSKPVSSTVASSQPTSSASVSSEIVSSKPVVNTLEFISLITTVKRNEVVTVTVQGEPNTAYNLSVEYSSGHVSEAGGLGNKISDESGVVSWSWKIGGKTKPGASKFTVKGGDKTSNYSFEVLE